MKKALITGATSGLGKEIAEYYWGKHYRVISISTESHIDQTDVWYKNWIHYNCDLADQVQVTNLMNNFTRNIRYEGPIDVLVNNAGALELNEDLLSPKEYSEIWTLLLYVPYILMREVKVEGHIINIASVSGMKADPDTPMYGALKAGLISLTKSFAHKLAPVRVNCISPGFFNTNLVPGEVPAQLLEPVPLQREAQPSEIIPVVEMLDKSNYITGANIVIDGGLIA